MDPTLQNFRNRLLTLCSTVAVRAPLARHQESTRLMEHAKADTKGETIEVIADPSCSNW
jgi:hypothetical protein